MEKHPKMVALAEQMAEVRKAVIGEVQRVIASLENQYNALTAQENDFKQLFNTQKSTVIQADKDVMSYAALRRDLDISLPYTCFLLNGDMKLYRNWHFLI